MAFTGSRTVTIDHTKCGATNSTDFPVLFAGTYAYLATVANGGSVTSSSGHDICFFSDSGLTTALDWELVEYDPATGKIEAHVRVGTLSASTDTVFYLGFGDSGITTFQGDVAGTWNSAYKLVAHLPNGTSLTANDSTSNANNGTVTNAVAAAGKIGGGASFDGAGDSINFGSGSSLDTLTTQTIEMWIKRGSVSTTTDQHIASKEWNDGSGFGGWWFYLRRDSDGTHGGKLKFGRGWSGSTYESALWRASTKLNSTTPWYHCVVTYDAGSTSNNPIIYLNGVAETTTNEQAPSGTLKSDNPYNVRMGEGSYGENDYNGQQDEFRVSNVVRSADWVLATYNNHNDPSTFYAITGGSTAYTLTASGGSFTLTGTAATLRAGRYLSAAAGTYTLTGTAASLRAGRHLSAGAGAFTLTGTDATLIYGSVGAYTLAANGGTFALTGGDANLIAARRLTASSGTFTLTGSDATLKAGRRLTASGGSYTLTGTAATLKAGRVIAANGGTFTLTGTAAALRAARLLSASGGVFALTGTDATLIYGQIGNFTLSAEGGTFTLTGGAAALTAARRLSAAGATYTLTGMDAALKAGRRLVASGGAFTLTGTDAALVYSGARSTAFYVTGRSGVRYQITADSGHRYIIEAASEPRYRATRRE